MAPFSTAETRSLEDMEAWALETLDSVLSTPAQRMEARVILGMSWEESLELESEELEAIDKVWTVMMDELVRARAREAK